MKDNVGVIYILTNPSFPQFVKIGYADDLDTRLKGLNNHDCLPFSFRAYATYEVPVRLSDLKLHNIIDKLNPKLRTIEKSANGKQRKREFYAMSKEDAYDILLAIAEIHGTTDKLKIIEPTVNEQKDEDLAEEIEIESNEKKFSEAITLEDYLSKKNADLVNIYKKLQNEVFDKLDNTEIYVLPQYIGWRKNGKYFAEIHILQNKIRIGTLVPNQEYSIGKKLPDSYLWVLNYRFYISNDKEIDEAVAILKDSYNNR